MLGGKIEQRNGKTVFVIGLSHENLSRLENGDPIAMSSESHPFLPADIEIVLMGGENESSLLEHLRQAGIGVGKVKDLRNRRKN